MTTDNSIQNHFQSNVPRRPGGRKRENLVGKTYNQLTIIEMLPKGRVRAICSCGKETTLTANKAKRGDTRSCGCLLRLGNNRPHGMTKTPTFRSWQLISQRCYNEKDEHYPDYGGRGISVCLRWRDSFENFLADMGERPSIKHTIDRINNNGNYEPGNCRWATKKEQGRNRRNNTILTMNGVSKCLADWADDFHIEGRVITYRMKRGWPIEKAIKTPSRKGNNGYCLKSD